VLVTQSAIPDVLVLEPDVFRDARGFFLESWNEERFRTMTGLSVRFVQDNHSRSVRGVLRGLHYQVDLPQGKLLRVARGMVFDVAVDLRRRSPWFGRWMSTMLSDQDHRMLWLPPGFAHGFLVLSPEADFLYKTTAPYSSAGERTLLWNDPALAIEWPLEGVVPVLSEKDADGTPFARAEAYDWDGPGLASA